ncbi:hypothetical protein HMPREF9946_02232 [Acetobacteraceae bacterium AT-5844]|nr:hypothetical protein HMPREF9946_02232 [Acetobacteraceae bacterium AT-5844]
MAKLSQFRQNSTAIIKGEWVPVGDEFGDLEILTRGFTDEYYDAQAARQRVAARDFDGDVSRLPTATRRSINLDCLIDHVLLGVRNLEHDEGPQAGKPVTLEEFHDLLRNPDYAELVAGCFKAPARVGRRRKADLADAVGNSASTSATS